MRIGRIRLSTRKHWLALNGLALTFLAWIGGCSSDSDSGVTDPPFLTASSFLVSDTASGAEPAARSGSNADVARSLRVNALVYVSLAEGEIPTGTSATIRNWRTGATLTSPMVAGGFDPVAVEADAGDTVEVAVEVSSGVKALSFLRLVPATAPPIVVRTEPAEGKRDVPLNARILIVFSEPIDPTTLNGTAIRLKRGFTFVAGEVVAADAEGLRAEFVPAEPLAPSTDYELVLTQEIEDLDGEPLSKPFTASFTTGAVNPLPEVMGQIAYVSRGSDAVEHIFLLDLDQSTVTQLTSGTAPDGAPTWSPDRTKIAFRRLGSASDGYSSAGTWIMNADGSGAERRTVIPAAPSWSPDGTKLVLVGNGMWIVNATGSPGDLKVLDSLPGLVGADSPSWSPDGSTIAFEGTTDVGDLGYFTQAYLVDADGSNVRRLTSDCTYGGCGGQSAEGSPAWSPDGGRVAFWSYGYGITVANRNGSGAYSVTHDGMVSGGSGPATGFNAHPSWSPDGQWLVFQSPWPDGQLVVARANGTGQPTTVTSMPGGASSPAWSR
jgi:Tol biopolymer transport system component